jgi:hypothetical protein
MLWMSMGAFTAAGIVALIATVGYLVDRYLFTPSEGNASGDNSPEHWELIDGL